VIVGIIVRSLTVPWASRSYSKDKTLVKEVYFFFLSVNSANGRVHPGQNDGGGNGKVVGAR